MSAQILLHRSAKEHQQSLLKKEYSAKDLAQACLKQKQKYSKLGAFLQCDEKKILEQAEASDKRYAKDKALGPLDGIPISIKDNICQEGEYMSCGSRILEAYISPYDARVIKKLKAAGAVLFGRTNMDEFAMGSSTENSAFQKTCNPWQEDCVPGGSSGGAAVSVAACITPLALGSDTGGSIRQPASFCGVFGLRPSYGRVSRYGLTAFASSLDQIGPLARSTEDCALVLSVIENGKDGPDELDSTSKPESQKNPIPHKLPKLPAKGIEGLKIGLLHDGPEIQSELREEIKKIKDFFVSKYKAKLVPLRSKLEETLIPIYYILATAEASSNLSRYDGVRYGQRVKETSKLKELYIASRTQGFGAEVRRRILLGTFVLSSGYYEAYYKKAQIACEMIKTEYNNFFKEVDIILGPTSPGTAFRFGERKDPLAMYQSDLFTIPAALAGLPSISIPVGLGRLGKNKSLPIGIQLTAPPLADLPLLQIAKLFESSELSSLDYSRFT